MVGEFFQFLFVGDVVGGADNFLHQLFRIVGAYVLDLTGFFAFVNSQGSIGYGWTEEAEESFDYVQPILDWAQMREFCVPSKFAFFAVLFIFLHTVAFFDEED